MIRPIGKPPFESHLLDIFSSIYWHRQIPYEDDLQKEAAYGSPIWKSEPEIPEDMALITAVTGLAVLDYIEWWEKRECAKLAGDSGREVLCDSRCLDLENDFFRQYAVTEEIFEELLYRLHTAWSAEEVRRQIKRNYTHFINNIGKGKKNGLSDGVHKKRTSKFY